MATAPTLPADMELVRALRAGDEAVFMDLVRRWHPSMLRVAQMYVPAERSRRRSCRRRGSAC